MTGELLLSAIGSALFLAWLAWTTSDRVRAWRDRRAAARTDREIAAAAGGLRAGHPRLVAFGDVVCTADVLKRVHVVCAPPRAPRGVAALNQRGDLLVLSVDRAHVPAARQWVSFMHGLDPTHK